jgi:ABC-2 type transport system permease protein
MWQRIGTLIIKELLAVWRDPKSRAILVVPPVIEMCIFVFAATQEIKNVHVAVLNHDWGIHSRDLVERFEGSPNFAAFEYLRDERDIQRAIDSGSYLMVVHIQPDFSRKVARGEQAPVQLILDGRRSNAAQIAAGYATEIVNRYAAELPRSRGMPALASVVLNRSWFNPNLDAAWNAVPSLVAILTTLMGLMVTALSVARERELGTFEQLLVSPMSPREIIIGKTVPAILIGVGEATAMILVGIFGFGVTFHGSFIMLYASMLVYLFAVIGVGLFVSSLAKTQQQAFLGVFVFMVPSFLLSGFASPIENMPDWLQTLTLINPVRYFIVIVKGIFLKDLPLVVVLQNLWPLTIIAAITMSSAGWLFRHRVE